MLKLIKQQKHEYDFVRCAGPDFYYSNKDGFCARHRSGGDTNELTVKRRIGDTAITVRRETNLKLDRTVTALDVMQFFKDLGFGTDVRIHKDCDIYFIRDGRAEVDIVWYKVTSNGRTRQFIEVEVGGLSKQDSLRVLNRWASHVEKMFKLKNKSDLSLYEIYSGRRYRS
jgi:adenylate cyclase class IV